MRFPPQNTVCVRGHGFNPHILIRPGEFNAAYAKAAVSVDQKIAGARMMLLLGEAPKKAAALLAVRARLHAAARRRTPSADLPSCCRAFSFSCASACAYGAARPRLAPASRPPDACSGRAPPLAVQSQGAKPTAFELEGSVTACSLLAGWAPAKAEVFQATCGLVFPLASFFAPKKAEEEA